MLLHQPGNNQSMRILAATRVLRDRVPRWSPCLVSPDGERRAAARGSRKRTPCLPKRARRLAGRTSLPAVKKLQVNGTTRRANGNFNLEGDTEIFLELPDKFRRNESLTLGGGGSGIDRTEILNGSEFSTEVSGDFGGRGRGRFGGVRVAGAARRRARGTLTPGGAGAPPRLPAPQSSE